ncbi:MAG: hypothetical protein ACHQXA_02495 [Gemmatimonadales bacterium]
MLHRPLLLAAFLAAPMALRAQGATTLTLSGSPLAFPAPVVADFDNGSLAATGALTYSAATSGGGPKTSRTSTVSIRASSATLGGTKPVSDLQWRRADLGTWNSLTTSDVQVEQRAMVRATTNDPWSNQVFFRVLLSYANDAPGSYSTSVIFTLTITTP